MMMLMMLLLLLMMMMRLEMMDGTYAPRGPHERHHDVAQCHLSRCPTWPSYCPQEEGTSMMTAEEVQYVTTRTTAAATRTVKREPLPSSQASTQGTKRRADELPGMT
jgi:hypothetical protein